MKILNCITLFAIPLMVFYSTSYAEEHRYISSDVSACVSLQFNCKSHEEAFSDRYGCGCQTKAAFKYRYINYEVESCLTLLFDCEADEYPFFNQRGCGCRKPVTTPDCQSAVDISSRQIKLAEAGISFTIPASWTQRDELLWSLDAQDTVQFGFQWRKVNTEWQPDYILPENSTVLKFSLLNLAWEYGLSYLIKINNLAMLQSSQNASIAKAEKITTVKKNNVLIDSMLAIEINQDIYQQQVDEDPQTSDQLQTANVTPNQSHQIIISDIIPVMSGNIVPMTTTIDQSSSQLKQFANHLLVLRADANIVYDFYLQANHLADLKKRAIDFQQVVRSGRLNSIKQYISRQLVECHAIHLQCRRGKIPFLDDIGCGCITNSPR